MKEIILINPSIEFDNDLKMFCNEILDSNDNDKFAGCSSLQNYNNISEWIEYLKDQENEETVHDGKVPSNTYLAVRLSDNKIVGIADLRHHIEHPVLGLWGGHIGYSIRPDERNKGYGKEILRLVLLKSKQFGLNKILVTCSSSNIASDKCIIFNGGIFEKTINVDDDIIKRYWISI